MHYNKCDKCILKLNIKYSSLAVHAIPLVQTSKSNRLNVQMSVFVFCDSDSFVFRQRRNSHRVVCTNKNCCSNIIRSPDHNIIRSDSQFAQKNRTRNQTRISYGVQLNVISYGQTFLTSQQTINCFESTTNIIYTIGNDIGHELGNELRKSYENFIFTIKKSRGT